MSISMHASQMNVHYDALQSVSCPLILHVCVCVCVSVIYVHTGASATGVSNQVAHRCVVDTVSA